MADEYQLRKDIDKLRLALNELDLSKINEEMALKLINDALQDIQITTSEGKCCGVSYESLLETLEDYLELSSNEYTLFRGDCWTINNNFEASAAITSTSNDNFTVTGTFRTTADLIGVYWNSKDIFNHEYISYGARYDYTGVTLEFDYAMSGCRDFINSASTITINKTDGSIYYVPISPFISNGHVTIPFDQLKLVSGNSYVNNQRQTIMVSGDTPISVRDIESVMLVLIPPADVYDPTQYEIIENIDFVLEVTNIEATNSYICNEHRNLKPHKYRICEGYDDIYNLNPYRLCKEMRKLGYVEWADLYIGASHYYEKEGNPGDIITVMDFTHERTGMMELDPTTPLNCAFEEWLDCYARELKANGTDKLIVSVSMENLQCPEDWQQVDCDGNPALTGWVPSTYFYSPCNSSVITYMQSVSEACLDIVVDNAMQPILQMGEAWWWWNENDTPLQPPCFYDDATKTRYYDEFNTDMPEYQTSWATTYDSSVMSWLNLQLTKYSDKLREVVNKPKYSNGLYMALFFPPSVLDTDRVPAMMAEVNYITGAYSPAKLDILQLEDYDWVTGLSDATRDRDRGHHPQVYSIGQELGFTLDRLHYYGGFVQYPEDAIDYWRWIKEAMDTALELGFAEVYVWAGSQVRRDCKFIGYDNFESIMELVTLINSVEIPTRTSDLINDGDGSNPFLTQHQDISGKLDIAQTNYKGKNVYVNNTTGNIDFEDKITKTSDLTNDGDGTYDFVTTNDSRLSDSRNFIITNISGATSSNHIYLNDYTSKGFYCGVWDTEAPYIDNCPLSGADNRSFFLLVEQLDGTTNYVKQTLTYHHTGKTYVRIKSGSWGNWKELLTEHQSLSNYYTKGQIDDLIGDIEEDMLQ